MVTLVERNTVFTKLITRMCVYFLDMQDGILVFVCLCSEIVTELYGRTDCYRVMCALSVSSVINVSNTTFGLTVHLSFIWLLIRVSLYM